jgi:phospholipase C
VAAYRLVDPAWFGAAFFLSVLRLSFRRSSSARFNISPFTRDGGVAHMTVTHESILKLISYRFGLGYLTARHRYASDIGRSFDFEQPDFEPPELPTPEAVAVTPCFLQGGGHAPMSNPEPHDLTKLETSGLLEKLGYEVPKLRAEDIFRSPHRVSEALSQSE